MIFLQEVMIIPPIPLYFKRISDNTYKVLGKISKRISNQLWSSLRYHHRTLIYRADFLTANRNVFVTFVNFAYIT